MTDSKGILGDIFLKLAWGGFAVSSRFFWPYRMEFAIGKGRNSLLVNENNLAREEAKK